MSRDFPILGRNRQSWLTIVTVLTFAAFGAAPAAASGAAAQSLSWTDWADLALASPVVLVGTVENVDRLSRRDAPDLPPSDVRALVQVKLQTVLKAPAVMPQGAAWLWQGPANAKGRAPFDKKEVMLAFAKPLSGGARPDVQALQLVSPNGQQPWSQEAETQVRAILQEALRPAAQGLMVTGISDAFRTEGDIPGTSESQFFLTTEGGRPVTLVVQHEPGREPVVLAGAGDLVDRAQPIRPQTLLWRGLACGLPAQLPTALSERNGLSADYRLAKASIGACGRTLTPPR